MKSYIIAMCMKNCLNRSSLTDKFYSYTEGRVLIISAESSFRRTENIKKFIMCMILTIVLTLMFADLDLNRISN